MNLHRKVLLGYGIGLASIALLLTWSVVNLVELGHAGEAILRENYESILAAENMIGALERQDSAALLILLGREDQGEELFQSNESAFEQWLGRAKGNVTIQGEAEILDTIEKGYDTYLEGFSGLTARLASDPTGARESYLQDLFPRFQSLRDAALRLRELNEGAMFAASRKAERVSDTALWSTVVVGLCVLSGGLLFSVLLTRRIVRPIHQVVDATEALADGNYEVQVPTSGTDELARLASAFNAMARRLGTYNRVNVARLYAEKRKSEAVLQSIEDAVLVVDAELRVTNMNPEACRLFDVRLSEVEGRNLSDVIRDERLVEAIRSTSESGRLRKADDEEDTIALRRGEVQRDYLCSVSPLAPREGRSGAVLLLRDVTRLKTLDRLKSEFVMTASHELKTPLHSLGMSIDLLTERASAQLGEEERALLAAAHEEVQRLKSLVGDLLDLSRIEQGRLELDLQPVSVELLAEKAALAFEVQTREAGAQLSLELPRPLPRVRADATKIAWVLSNLISNALRHVERGGHVRVAARPVGGWMHLSVRDDGAGIAAEDQARIFEKFVQVPGQKSVGGTGLGLAISREIVRAHSGRIWVESTPGEGSTFSFTLPVVQEPLAAGGTR